MSKFDRYNDERGREDWSVALFPRITLYLMMSGHFSNDRTIYYRADVRLRDGEVWHINRHHTRRRRSTWSDAKWHGVRGLARDCGFMCYFRLRQSNGDQMPKSELHIHLTRWKQLPQPNNKFVFTSHSSILQGVADMTDVAELRNFFSIVWIIVEKNKNSDHCRFWRTIGYDRLYSSWIRWMRRMHECPDSYPIVCTALASKVLLSRPLSICVTLAADW